MPQTPQPRQQYTSTDSGPLAPPPDPIASLRDALRGHYEIERELGQGAFAAVYLARDLKHERKVAIKVLHVDPNSEMGELRFVREIRMLARLQHPNILPLHDSGHVENLLYYVMPYVSGETLRDRLRAERQLPWEEACNIAREVADALGYAHEQGIIHRDIKPENILLSAGHPILADFGIARAIDVAGIKQLTRTGMGSPGTPAYMSPEQLLGVGQIDARSDIYALGCVFFEMLTGNLPFPGEEGLVNRFTEPPPIAGSVRKDLPAWIDAIIATALAKSPIDRFQTAPEFVDVLNTHTFTKPSQSRIRNVDTGTAAEPNALSQKGAPPYKSAFASTLHSATINLVASIRSHSIALSITTLMLASGAFVATKSESFGVRWFAPHVDSRRVAVMPVSGAAPIADRARFLTMLYDALGEWRGLDIVNSDDVADQIGNRTGPLSPRAGAVVARKLGAGRFVWGDMNSTSARLQLYEVGSPDPLRTVSVTAGDSASLRASVSHLLADPGSPRDAAGGDGRTTSYPSWLAYGRGHTDLWNGNLADAETQFRRAIASDQGFAPAHFWLAQTLAWRAPNSRADWRAQLTQALTASSGLSPHDRDLAVALSNLVDGKYPAACRAYSRLARADSLDFVSLYGLGQCLLSDSLVLRDPTSPSHWRFRSKYADAANAFMRALIINPNAHAILSFDELLNVLPIAPTKTRRGRSADGAEFAAYATLIHDSVVFLPYPIREFASLSAQATSNARNAAIQTNLNALLDFTVDWTRQSPQSAQAFMALADVREARGEIGRERSGGMSALDAVHRARFVSATAQDKLISASRDAWLTFKMADYSKARSIADSLLASSTDPSNASQLIGLAALTGKINKTAQLARLTNDYAAGVASLPVAVVDAAAPLFAFAVLGVCGDTTNTLLRQVDDQLNHFVAEARLKNIRQIVEARPLAMMGPCTDGKASLKVDAGTSRTLKLEQAFATHDTLTLRKLFRDLRRDARTQRPGDYSMDFIYLVAWQKAASGDTIGAITDLDRSLGALPSLSGASLRDAASAAAVTRAMALRADIASARNQREVQKKWSKAVIDLWGTADAPLQPTVGRMRSLAASVSR